MGIARGTPEIERSESGLDAAYRELLEETGINRKCITLTHLMDFIYCLDFTYVQCYAGVLEQDIPLISEVNELFWSDLNHDFFDVNIYAGEGNIGHMILHAQMSKDKIIKAYD